MDTYWLGYIHYNLNRTAISTLESKGDENTKYYIIMTRWT